MDVLAAVDTASREAEVERMASEARGALDGGASVVVYAAKTVEDDAFRRLQSHCEGAGMSFAEAQSSTGSALGDVADRLIRACGIGRMVIAGGDTSGRVMEALPIAALEAAHPFASGAPMCRCWSGDSAFNGLEVVLKGGDRPAMRISS